ncbi:MAG: TonB-dependent receptor [Desulfatiglans sp.]|jgi:iron complex outermembrane receptor protein|nr:TonB-dependent receptor [Thermodesulfobacteriota bacterium]MEE4353018.1 TonB-dependent receptor [Desulfatiglans sp.]
MKKWMFVLVCFPLVCLSALCNAQEEEDGIHELEEVVVTATHKTKMIDTPASISIITAKELEEMGAKNIIEALTKIPGVIDTSAKDDAVAIRGTGSSMAGGPVILIDGVPQKIGDYRYDHFSFIPVSQIERIEVLRSAGVAYGPGSSRGVINIITKKGKRDKPVHFNLSASYGSWNTHEEYADLSGAINQWDYFINASNYKTDGYEEEEKSRFSTLLKLGYNLSEQTRLGVRYNFLTNDHDTVYGFAKYQYQLDNYRRNIHFPVSETDPTLVWHNERDQDVSTYAVEFSHAGDKYFASSALSYIDYEERYNDSRDIYISSSATRGDLDDKDQETYAFTLSGGGNFDFGGISYTPSVGVNCEDIDFTQRKTYPYGPDESTAAGDFDISEKQYGLFWDNDILLEENWGLRIGGRIDKAEVEFEDRAGTKVDQDKTMFGWSVAPSCRFMDKANIYVSVGRSFWFPTPRYYAWAAEKASPNNLPGDLKPEESLTYEIGYKHMMSRSLNISLTGFFTECKDKFASYYEGSTWKGVKNIGETETKGIELEADGRLRPFLGYRFAGSYLDTQWTEGQMRVYVHPTNVRELKDLNGMEFIGIPVYSFTMGLDFYPVKGLKSSVDVNYTGSEYVDYLNRIEYGSKTTVDASISYTTQNWKFWVLGKNLFDEEIENVQNSTGRLTSADGEPRNAYYVQDGVYVEVGVSYHF